MVGYKGAWDAQGDAYFGWGTGKIWTSNVVCYGNETSIGECGSDGWGSPVCGHDDDVSVTCIKPDDGKNAFNHSFICLRNHDYYLAVSSAIYLTAHLFVSSFLFC